MNIHEYQAKKILADYGVKVPFGLPVLSKDKIEDVLDNFEDGTVLAVKAQIHSGGRGKAGGVKIVKSKNEAIQETKNMFGKLLVTNQTGPEGKEVNTVYVEQGSAIDQEYYLGLLVDTSSGMVTFIASSEGGVEIEEVAATHPEKIIKVTIDPTTGMLPFHARLLAFKLGLKGPLVKDFTKLAMSLYKAFIDIDASQIEINPLILTKDSQIVALDAKINFEDNALFRHKNFLALRDESEENPLEIRASEFDLSYIKMDGEIGCMVNGAGLAMATMDIIKLYGSEPANFLDVGGGATKEKVTEAFKIILSDSNVKGILVNIFGGIMRCDIIAEGIIAAAQEVELNVPLVVRLAGTNFELGKQILDSSVLKIISADDLADAADKIVKLVKD